MDVEVKIVEQEASLEALDVEVLHVEVKALGQEEVEVVLQEDVD